MFEPLPRSPAHLQAMADSHGGYGRLLRWGALYFGMQPLLRAARAKAVLTGQPVIGVGGTQGKTTTVRALRHVFGLPMDRWTDANTNVRGELGWSVLRTPRTSPAIVELGDGTGAFETAARWLQPQCLIILNVMAEHLYALGTLDAAAAEFEPLVAACSQTLVLNADDPSLHRFPRMGSAHVRWFGESASADVRIRGYHRTSAQRLAVELVVDGEPVSIGTNLVGDHYRHVVAATMAAATSMGVPADTVRERLMTLSVTPSRLEPFTTVKGATVLSDDYKATPETVLAGLREIALWPAEHRWMVIGDLTNMHPDHVGDFYREVAREADRTIDRVLTFGPGWVEHADAWDGLSVDVRHVGTVRAAAEAAMADHGSRDVIYVKGSEDERPRRVSLRLAGHSVGCWREECKREYSLCDTCPKLRKG